MYDPWFEKFALHSIWTVAFRNVYLGTRLEFDAFLILILYL